MASRVAALLRADDRMQCAERKKKGVWDGICHEESAMAVAAADFTKPERTVGSADILLRSKNN